MPIATFRAVDTATDTLAETPFVDGATLSGTSLGVVVDPDIDVGSVSFYLDGDFARTENVVPYALFGDSGGDFFDGALTPGSHTLEVVFHAGAGGAGASLGSDSISFTVADGDASSDPVDPPLPEDPAPAPDPDPMPEDPAGSGPIDPNGLVAWADQVIFHFDGNNNDEDDIAAMPIAAVLSAAAGITDRMTFFYGNNIAERNDDRQLDKLDDSAAFSRSLGIDSYGYQDDIAGTTDTLVALLESGQKVLMIEGGPMEAAYRALEQTDPQYHANIRLLSHSSWNENRDTINRPGETEARTWSDIAEDFPGVEQVDIRDQNWGNNNDQGFNNNGWNAMDGSDAPLIAEARTAMEGATVTGNAIKKNDASDAGMLWYALTGAEDGTADDALDYIDASGILDDIAPNDPPADPVDAPMDAPDDDPVVFTLDPDHQSPLDSASYNAETGILDLVFDYGRLLQSSGEWGNSRHIDGLVIDGTVYPVNIHADDGPRDANGNFIYNRDTMENTFAIDIGTGRDPADGTFDFALTDGANGSGQLYAFSLEGDVAEPPVTSDPGGLVVAVNAGGGSFTAANGLVYAADDFDNGNSFSTNAAIAGTDDDGLYQTERWKPGGFTYDIAVENGTYDVELNFAEIWSGAQNAGQRVFDVLVEDTIVFNDLDIADTVGFNAALDLVGQVEVTDGSLTIATTAEVQNPKLAGFSIWDASGDLDETFAQGTITDDFVIA